MTKKEIMKALEKFNDNDEVFAIKEKITPFYDVERFRIPIIEIVPAQTKEEEKEEERIIEENIARMEAYYKEEAKRKAKAKAKREAKAKAKK